MFRFLFRIALVVVLCLTVYNYFFGNAVEKDRSKAIFSGVGNVFVEIKNLLSSERDKGTFDKALVKMDDVLVKLREHSATQNDPNLNKEISALEQRKALLETKAKTQDINKTNDPTHKYSDMARQIEDLTNDIQGLVNRVAPGQ